MECDKIKKIIFTVKFKINFDNINFVFMELLILLFSPLLLCLLLWLLPLLSTHLPLSMPQLQLMPLPQLMVLSPPTPTLFHPTTTTMVLLIQ
jgi:hypothetical protein